MSANAVQTWLCTTHAHSAQAYYREGERKVLFYSSGSLCARGHSSNGVLLPHSQTPSLCLAPPSPSHTHTLFHSIMPALEASGRLGTRFDADLLLPLTDLHWWVSGRARRACVGESRMKRRATGLMMGTDSSLFTWMRWEEKR